MPDWGEPIRGRLARLNLSGAREAEVVEELAQHLEDRYQELRTRGVSEEEARHFTLTELQEDKTLEEQLRKVRLPGHREPAALGSTGRIRMLGTLQHDLKIAFRAIRNKPAFSLMVIGMLAAGVAGNAAIFSDTGSRCGPASLVARWNTIVVFSGQTRRTERPDRLRDRARVDAAGERRTAARSFSQGDTRRSGIPSRQRAHPQAGASRGEVPEGAQQVEFYSRLLDRLRVLPGVQAAGAVSKLPLDGHDGYFFKVKGGRTISGKDQNPVVLLLRSTPGYFEAMGVNLLAGRRFDQRDGAVDGPQVAIVNESFAKYFWPNSDAMGKRIRYACVSTHEPVTYVCVIAGLAVIGLLANFIPARRASRVDPMRILRFE